VPGWLELGFATRAWRFPKRGSARTQRGVLRAGRCTPSRPPSASGGTRARSGQHLALRRAPPLSGSRPWSPEQVGGHATSLMNTFGASSPTHTPRVRRAAQFAGRRLGPRGPARRPARQGEAASALSGLGGIFASLSVRVWRPRVQGSRKVNPELTGPSVAPVLNQVGDRLDVLISVRL
jgi:hypothetical protein